MEKRGGVRDGPRWREGWVGGEGLRISKRRGGITQPNEYINIHLN